MSAQQLIGGFDLAGYATANNHKPQSFWREKRQIYATKSVVDTFSDLSELVAKNGSEGNLAWTDKALFNQGRETDMIDIAIDAVNRDPQSATVAIELVENIILKADPKASMTGNLLSRVMDLAARVINKDPTLQANVVQRLSAHLEKIIELDTHYNNHSTDPNATTITKTLADKVNGFQMSNQDFKGGTPIFKP